MLVRVEGDSALAIGQLSHAWLAGQLARAWGNARVGAVEPREEITLGAQQHDIGWAQFDREPHFDPDTGLPRDFHDLTVDEHLAIWRDAPDQLASQSTLASLVVSLHGASLSELRMRKAPAAHAAALQAHIDREHARQAWICAALNVSPSQTERIRRLIWAWDTLSLALCNACDSAELEDVPTAGDGLDHIELSMRADGVITLAPWPFAEATLTVHCEARRLTQRYGSEQALRAAYASAAPVELRFSLASGRARS